MVAIHTVSYETVCTYINLVYSSLFGWCVFLGTYIYSVSYETKSSLGYTLRF